MKKRKILILFLCILFSVLSMQPVWQPVRALTEPGASGDSSGAAGTDGSGDTPEELRDFNPILFDISQGSVSLSDTFSGVAPNGKAIHGVHDEKNLYIVTGVCETRDDSDPEHGISIAGTGKDFVADMQLQDTSIHLIGTSPLKASGEGTLRLWLKGENELTASGSLCAAVQIDEMKLILNSAESSEDGDQGRLTVSSGSTAAGIGSTNRTDCDITIEGGVLTALGGAGGAGIGSGRSGNALVIVKGGEIHARGGSGAAGVGSGETGHAEIVVDGGMIFAEGGDNGAAMGSGSGGNAKIELLSGSIEADGGIRGAGIGSGVGGRAEVIVKGGDIRAAGGYVDQSVNGGSGIGCGGYDSNSLGGKADIRISGGTIDALGGKTAAGIGSGPKGSAVIEISGGKINAEGITFGAGIGGGNGSPAEIQIIGGEITAKGSSETAGIGTSGSEAIVKISGGTVSAEAGIHGAGIGCGYKGSAKVYLMGGSILSKGGNSAAGIGGGFGASAAVEVAGGEVHAVGGSRGAGIGSGYRGIGRLTVTGGTVLAEGGSEAPGIGSGFEGKKADLVVRGGSLHAVAGEKGVAAGNGIELSAVTDGSREVKCYPIRLSGQEGKILSSIEKYPAYGLHDVRPSREGLFYFWFSPEELPSYLLSDSRAYGGVLAKPDREVLFTYDETLTERLSKADSQTPVTDQKGNSNSSAAAGNVDDNGSADGGGTEEDCGADGGSDVLPSEADTTADNISSGISGAETSLRRTASSGNYAHSGNIITAQSGVTGAANRAVTGQSGSAVLSPATDLFPEAVSLPDLSSDTITQSNGVAASEEAGSGGWARILAEVLLGLLIAGLAAATVVYMVRRKRYV